jgi:hypothetical protein
METINNGLPNQDDLGNQQTGDSITNPENSTEMSASAEGEERRERHRHHDDHHVNRKYRIFSNHSSYGDSPHTNTSF